MTPAEIAALCDPYDASPTECDGMTRILHTVLTKAEVPHQCYVGRVARRGGGMVIGILIPWHMWIETQQGIIVDYRLRHYLGGEAPHGVFTAPDMSEAGFEYRDARCQDIQVCDDTLFAILNTPFTVPQ